MPTSKITVKNDILNKENLQKKIRIQLSTALPILKKQLSEKKFKKRLKKVAKMLTEGIKKNSAKKYDGLAKKTITARKKTTKATTTK